jgi:membrane-bound serine protease (ClpP class)
LLVMCVAAVLALSSPVGGSAPSGIVAIKIDDPIQAITDEYVGRAIDTASAQNASAVLIEMKTPGGLMSSMQDIISRRSSPPRRRSSFT